MKALHFRVAQCSIQLPHLNYVVKVRHINARDVNGHTKAYAERHDRHSCTLRLPEYCAPPMAAHEVTHALQYICRDRLIDFDSETEHMGHLMQYIMGRIMGMVWAV